MLEIDENGNRFWKNKKGQYHRIDGPAVEMSSGTKIWYIHDMRHREDWPAVECCDGSREWWLNDQLHRIDGPAVDWTSGHKEWWLNGILYSESEYKDKVKKYVKNR